LLPLWQKRLASWQGSCNPPIICSAIARANT